MGALAPPADAPGRRRARRGDARGGRRTPTLPVLRNVDAGLHSDVDGLVDALVRQLYCPVQWTRCVQALAARGVGRLAECGPGKALAGMAKRIDRALEAKALGTPAEFDAALAEWSA
jgi:[acyl-carrier-protein] S-malonyltransferase